MTGIHGRGAISRRFSPTAKSPDRLGEGGMVHPFITGHLCPPRIALQHVLPATCCIDLRNALWPLPQVAGILAVTSLIHIDVIIFANGFRVVFKADLEHQDWAAAQFPPEEEQVHNRPFSVPKRASFESFFFLGGAG